MTPEELAMCAHARRIRAKMGSPTTVEMAERMGVNQSHVSAVLRGASPPGLDFMKALARFGHESLDYICFEPPPTKDWYPPPYVPGRRRAGPGNPSPASSLPQTRGRKAGGGKARH